MDNLMAIATGMISSETRRVEIAGQNIANLATPGYKRQIPYEEVIANAGVKSSPVVTGVTSMAIATDFTGGKLVHTANPLDLSITGAGMFEVATADGSAYTRYGAFQRDENARLVTSQGWPVQASGGGDVILKSNNWRIDRDGTVIDDGNPGSSIRVVTFADTSELQRRPDGLFTVQNESPTDVDQPEIKTGFVEASNVQNGTDMVQMMESMRRIEAAQKIVHVYDDMMGTAIQRLGDM